MSVTQEQALWFQDAFSKLVDNVDQAILGKREVIELVVTALLSDGHVLLEDFPGTGKTSLARALAQTVQGKQSRIQFTPDLLPGDVTGVTIYDQGKGRFEFHHGPIFASIVLADEINRASPKTQSALLEVMEESQVTVDGVTHRAGRPFMVIATQNPVEQAGTYPLPEAQLDRFLMKTSIGYPDHDSTMQILGAPHAKGTTLDAVITPEAVAGMSDLTLEVHVEQAVLDYVARLAAATREAPEVALGCSVRAALALVRCARTWAAASGRTFVLPDDVKELAVPVLAHRMMLDPEEEYRGTTCESVLRRLLDEVPAPQERVSA